MGKALRVISGFAVNPGAVVTALTVSPGDTFTVSDFDPPDRAYLGAIWAENATGGVLSIHSPRMHDNVQGIRLQIPPADEVQILPQLAAEPLFPNDPLVVAMSGGGAETDVLSYVTYYDNLPGVDGQFDTWAAIQPQIVHLMGLEVDLSSGATAGNYGGTRAMNADFPQLKADTRYAVLGYTMASKVATLGITGPDTGNVRIGAPGSIHSDVTGSWFVDLSNYLQKPCIPIIKANNAPATNIDVLSTDTATAHHASLILAQLSS